MEEKGRPSLQKNSKLTLAQRAEYRKGERLCLSGQSQQPKGDEQRQQWHVV
jgi:hypothetical protein